MKELTVSTPQAGSLMPDKVKPCESCYSEGTHQRRHYRSQRYHHPRQAQNHPQELLVARQVGMTQSKSHSQELCSRRSQHHKGYKQVLQEESKDNQLFPELNYQPQ